MLTFLICLIAIVIMAVITIIVISTPSKNTLFQNKLFTDLDDHVESENFFESDITKETKYDLTYNIEYSSPPEDILPTEIEDIDPDIRKTLNKILSQFKPLPASVFKILSVLRDPYANAADISSIVSTDPILSTTLLKVVNSAYFRPTHPVTSIGTAIVLLGFNNVRTLVIKDSISRKANSHLNKRYYDSLWLHSHCVSVCADFLAKNVFNYTSTDLATTGLLHDIGKYFMDRFKVKGRKQSAPNSVINEEKICGINHALLGSLIADKLQLPKIIGKPIEYHHYPTFFEPDDMIEPYGKLSFILSLADTICNGLGFRVENTEIHQIKASYFKKYGIKNSIESLITPALKKELAKARALVEAYSG